jgi:hypothetical protein
MRPVTILISVLVRVDTVVIGANRGVESTFHYLEALQRHKDAYAGDVMDFLLRTHPRRAYRSSTARQHCSAGQDDGGTLHARVLSLGLQRRGHLPRGTPSRDPTEAEMGVEGQVMLLFSVIMPAYNREEYVDQTLKSLIAQTFNDWECIAVDDGSKDSTTGDTGRVYRPSQA